MKKLFLGILLGLGLLSIIIPDRTMSDSENRILQEFPEFSLDSLFSGEFTSTIDTYTSDQVVFRDQFIKLNTVVDRVKLKQCINDVYMVGDRLYNRYSSDDIDLEQVEKNINALNKFTEKHDNAKVILIPMSSDLYKEELPFFNDNISYDVLNNINGVIFADELLDEHKDEYIYYKTDHHWTTLGAYYLYSSLVDNPVEYNKETVSDDFWGTIHSKINIKCSLDQIDIHKSNTNFEVFYDGGKEDKGLYFDKYLETKDQYSYFLDSNHALVQIVNKDINNGKTLLLIKDSFSNCLAPFLAEHYENVYILDLRYFNGSVDMYAKMISADDIYVIYNKINFMQDKNIFKLSK